MSRTPTLHHLRRLSTTTPTPTTATPTTATGISISRAKSQLRNEYDPDKALQIYSSLSKHYSSPVTSRYAIGLTVRRLAKSQRFSDIIHLLESQKTEPNITQEPFLSTIIRSYGLAGMFDHALRTYHQMDQLGTPRTSLSFNALLTACNNSKLFHNVPKLFDEITLQYGILPDKVSYGILIKSFCETGQPEKALEILKGVQEKNVVEITAVTYTTILDALYRKKKSDDDDETEKLWCLMKEKRCIDVTAFNVRLKCVSGGAPEKVKAMIDEMVDHGLKPDTITYNYLMACYLKRGMIKEAKEVYDGFYEKGCRHNAATFRTLLFYLCMNKDFEGAFKVFKKTVKVNNIPDFGTLKLLVQGLVTEGKQEEAKELIRNVKMKFPSNMLKAWTKVEKNLNLSSNDDEAASHTEEPNLDKVL